MLCSRALAKAQEPECIQKNLEFARRELTTTYLAHFHLALSKNIASRRALVEDLFSHPGEVFYALTLADQQCADDCRMQVVERMKGNTFSLPRLISVGFQKSEA